MFDTVLNGRPDIAEEKGCRQHNHKADGDDEGRSLEDAEPVRNFRIIEAVVEIGRNAGNEDGAEHAHVQGLDVGNHGQTRTGSGVLTIIDAEIAAVEAQDTRNEVVEDHVNDETFHSTASLLLLGKANGNGDGEENRHLFKYRPGTLLDDVPEIVPQSSLFR